MRTHTYWKTYEDYLKWSLNPPKQINYVTKELLKQGVHTGHYSPRNGGYAPASRVHIKFID